MDNTPVASAAGTLAPTAAAASSEAATSKKAKNSVTITFDDQDTPLFAAIQKAAAADDRTEAKFLLLYLRKNFNKA